MNSPHDPAVESPPAPACGDTISDTQGDSLRAILDAVPDALLGLDRNGTILLANDSVNRLFGAAPDDLVGRPLEVVLPGFDPGRLSRLVEGGIIQGAKRIRSAKLDAVGTRSGGISFDVEVSLTEMTGDGAVWLTCAIRDITDQRQADEALRLFSRALDFCGNGIVISDVRLPGMPVVYANPTFEHITGYPPTDAIGRNCAFLQGGQRESPETLAARKTLRIAIDSGQATTVVIENFRSDGSPFWNELAVAPVRDAAGHLTHYVGVQSDITDRIRTEHALSERMHRLDAILDLSPDGFALFDAQQRLVYVNPSFLAMTGLPADLVRAGPRLDEFDDTLRTLCATDEPYVSLTAPEPLDGSRADSSTLYLESPKRILERRVRHAGAGGTATMIVYFRDVTRETELDRMKSEFLSTAAHELRTPMASIFGFTELLLRRSYDEKTRLELLGTVHKQALLLMNLLNELLDLSRMEARAAKDFKLRLQPLAPVVENAVAAVLSRSDPRHVSVSFPEERILVRADAEKLQQALLNILSNAYKYSPQSEPITLSVAVAERKGRRMVGIAVRDCGIGMTPEQLSRAFERFYRADTSGNIPGTGLGLALVKEIAELQGGTVEIESEFGKGTCVTFWLPVPDSALAVAA